MNRSKFKRLELNGDFSEVHIIELLIYAHKRKQLLNVGFELRPKVRGGNTETVGHLSQRLAPHQVGGFPVQE